MKNLQLRPRTQADIDSQVTKVLKGLGNPEPPLDLRFVRELLKLDRQYYSTSDDGVIRELVSRLRVAGVQVLKRPTILADAVQSLNLKALYLPDQKRILLDRTLPLLKHRWNEAHEIGHDIVPWHAGMMLGDTEITLSPLCHAQMEGEANYAAGRLLFLGDLFSMIAHESQPTLKNVLLLKTDFGNTITSTLWRYVETVWPDRPLVALITAHPHPSRRKPDFDRASACRHCVQSPGFVRQFSKITEEFLFDRIESYCGSQRGGPLGEAEIDLADDADESHVFHFETFFNGYEALTLGKYLRKKPHVG